MRKWFIAVPVLLVLTFSLAISLTASGGSDYIVEEDTSHKENCIETQHERLLELLRGNFIVPFDFGGELDRVPRINLVIPPEGTREYFVIGVEGTLTQECIDFILFYTGIPGELANISEAYLDRQGGRQGLFSYNCPDTGHRYEAPWGGRWEQTLKYMQENSPNSSAIPYLMDKLVYDKLLDVEMQHERLLELISGNFIVPFDFDGELDIIPSVNLIVPPEGTREYFVIGVEGTLTQECIDFILFYTGIPEELANISEAYLERQYLFIYTCPDTGYERETTTKPEHWESIEYIDFMQEIVPYNATFSMGQMMDVHFLGGAIGFTIGHPINSQGIRFATSLHRTAAVAAHRPVTTYLSLFQIGTVSGTVFFDQRRDVALVNTAQNITISTVVPGAGGSITNFRATANFDDNVMSLRGRSGPQTSWVWTTNASARFTGDPWYFGDKIGIYPDRTSIGGDSGAALIRRNSSADRAVLGTRSGFATIGGRRMGIYTKVTNY
ncbi:MAG: hypothetical protein FWC91_10030 [Defluviitaleaceae bacterium]|nr:hypothetical protein [Defluviitaleaceae bacterium]